MTKYIIPVVAVLGMALGSFVTGSIKDAEASKLAADLETAKAKNLELVVEAERKANEISETVAVDHTQAVEERQAKTITITKEVIKYVESGHNQCVIDSEWVRITDSATPMPRTSATACELTNACEGVPSMGQELEVIASNYNVCQAESDELAAYKAWHRKMLSMRGDR